ncbi:glycosyltransferase family 2 protein [Dendrosporobacter sp. 1207_IL3150]|uniref:glycosyltransferase family 2 protein n=1 Tax=Dendrosporobacter sp. 1207_IL3150 TaxID=3084054 RepID=UPI002FDAE52F
MDLSIIIPSFNERNNVRLLVNKIRKTLNQIDCQYEIFFVDDSRDDTPAILEDLANKFSEVRYIHRENERGLASAVVKGFENSSGRKIIIMDADLQHPPELLPLLFSRLDNADIVIPSRFVPGGSDGGLNTFRKIISWTARVLGQAALKKLRRISDCTSGFFAINRSVIANAKLDPIGWKILMEVLAKGNYQAVHEIPYSFVARDAGESKMSIKEQWNYLKHIAKLIAGSPEDRRFYLYGFIGFLGVFVNMISLKFLLSIFYVDGLIASILASCIAMVHNFALNDAVTWKRNDKTTLWANMVKFPQFALVCSVGILITALITQLFIFLNLSIYLGQLTGIVIAFYWGFLANNKWTWSPQSRNLDYQDNNLIVTQESPSKFS